MRMRSMMYWAAAACLWADGEKDFHLDVELSAI